MKFTDKTKSICLAIVSVFETSRPFDDFGAYAVLGDGAGVSYGINQFTHRSGSLLAVVESYLASGGVIGRRQLIDALYFLRRRDAAAIRILAGSRNFEKALKAAAVSREMRAAQTDVARRFYLGPALEACGALGLELPLSLAVVYDSMVHGSWPKLRDGVKVCRPAECGNEKEWVTAYVRARHKWLRASPRLAASAYRTRFFLGQIALGRWRLELPMNVNGVVLTQEILFFATAEKNSAAEPAITSSDSLPPAGDDSLFEASSRNARNGATRSTTQPPNTHEGRSALDAVESSVNRAAAGYDRVEAVIKTMITRKDAAKSLWTTIVATIWQTVWAAAGFIYDMPRPIWLAAAVIAGVLAAIYMYRQITLGKIRERAV